MTEVIYLDEHSQPIESDREIRAALDEITDILASMSKEQRIAWFRRTQYPHPINFEKEIDGTVYTVSTCFDKNASESLEEKTQRIILKRID